MIENFTFYISLIIAIILVIMLANKLKIAYPILLVLAGLYIAINPRLPNIRIDPELIFVIFLPPLLYEAAWAISWKELWHWRRIISSFAFVVVFLTALSVALVANSYIPGFSLALGFLLGGIVSPPDAVSASAIIKFVKIPKSMSSIIEGESLLNDASSLIIFRFAMIAVATGQFIWQDAALNFGWMLLGGVAIGLLVAKIFMAMHKFLPTDTTMDVALSIITPYVMYISAERLHSSGVLAVVCGGLYLSNKRHVFLNSSSRLRGNTVWESLTFLLNGLVFTMIGMDLHEITEGLKQEGVSFNEAIQYGLLITGVLIVGRILAAYGAVVVTFIMRNFITVAQSTSPGLKVPFLLGWTGMRGVVSLAAALSIPATLSDGSPFPHRYLILFITFIVILTTLLVQGLTLPLFIKKFNLRLPDNEEEIEKNLKRELASVSLQHLRSKYPELNHEHKILRRLSETWEQAEHNENELVLHPEAKAIYLDLLEQQRKYLLTKNKSERTLNEEIIRKRLWQIDIEEEKLKFY